MDTMRNQNGFTLIELVVVIVILGILAAVAVPKFIDMQSDARQASLDGLFGSVRSAMALSHAQALVDGVSNQTGQTITMEGTSITMDYGYPDAAFIDDAITLSSDFSFATDTTTTPPSATFTLTGGTNCTVTYEEAYVNASSVIVPATASVSTTCQ